MFLIRHAKISEQISLCRRDSDVARYASNGDRVSDYVWSLDEEIALS
jgi:hypothetical protein